NQRHSTHHSSAELDNSHCVEPDVLRWAAAPKASFCQLAPLLSGRFTGALHGFDVVSKLESRGAQRWRGLRRTPRLRPRKVAVVLLAGKRLGAIDVCAVPRLTDHLRANESSPCALRHPV